MGERNRAGNALPIDARMWAQKRVVSESWDSRDNQASQGLGRCADTHDFNATVFPYPGRADSNVSGPPTPSSMSRCRRGRTTRGRGEGGGTSFVRTIEEGPAFSVEPEGGELSLPSRGGDPTLVLAPADRSDAPKDVIVEGPLRPSITPGR
jgi:hypothetical protein